MGARARKARPAAPPQDAAQQRLCNVCGRGLTIPETSRAMASRLREIIGRVPPRPFHPSETEQLRRERVGEWEMSAAIHMRVTIGLLADELDGICVFCSRVGREQEA